MPKPARGRLEANLSLGEKLRLLRIEKGWTQERLAEAAEQAGGSFGSGSWLSRLETGGTGSLTLQGLDALATALEVPKEALNSEQHDAAINTKRRWFVVRFALEAFAAKGSIPGEFVQPLLDVLDDVQNGPRDANEWALWYRYAEVLLKLGLRKPMGREPARGRGADQKGEAGKPRSGMHRGAPAHPVPKRVSRLR